MDLIISFFMLILTAPILLLFCILIPIDSAGSPFFYQQRLGLDGKPFNMIKLRSMGIDAEKNGPKWASANDSRVTRIGAFIRKTRIDEIPQLINVLKGDMSLIGPRPEREYFYKEFEKFLPGFKNRLYVKPGITGWAQVNGGYDLSPKEKLHYDLYYIQHRSIAMEIKILFRTLTIVFTGNGAR
ncbi:MULTISPECIES: sugar transferase [Peribacillus]|uniref:sugar transferase n=1 Tax=Peribacillus TaxID=2675229 RepID=UPI00333912ED